MFFNRASSFENLVWSYFGLRKEMLKGMYSAVSYKSNKLFKQGLDLHRIWTFFNKRFYTIDKFDNLKAKILAKPLVFDRGIFDEKPTFIPNKQFEDSSECFADWYRYTQSHTDYQTFYNYPRVYDTLYKQDNDKSVVCEKKKNNIRLKTDREIRRNQMQDLFLKLIAEKLGEQVFGSSADESVISLSDVYVSQYERMNQRSDARSQSQRTKGDHSENKIKESFIWNKTFAYKQGQINEPAVRLKDFGKFKQLLEDSRVKTIFTYDGNRVWSKNEIEKEILEYEVIRREEILKSIQEFEGYLLSCENQKEHPRKFEDKKGNPSFREYIEEGVLGELKSKESSVIQSTDKEWLTNLDFAKVMIDDVSLQKPIVQKAFFLILLRNKFAHNQLINLECWNQLQKIYKPFSIGGSISIAEYLLETVKLFISEMKQELEK